MSIFGSSSKGDSAANSSHQRKMSYNSGSESDGELDKSCREGNKEETFHDKRFGEPRTKRTGLESYSYGSHEPQRDNNDRNYGLSSSSSSNYSTGGSRSLLPRRGNGTTR